MEKKIYTIKNLDCINCASKMEKKMNDLEGIDKVSLIFSTGELIVEAENPDVMLPKLREIASNIEPNVKITSEINSDKQIIHIKTHQHSKDCGCITTRSGLIRRIYNIENLCCRICADKMEQKILEIPFVENVSITFTTKQLIIEAQKDPDDFLDEIQNKCDSIKHDVELLKHKNVEKKKFSKDLLIILNCVTIFFAGLFFSNVNVIISFFIFLIGYVLIGYDVFVDAFKNLIRGQVFDENLLMTIATMAAFIMGERAEALGILLFFKIGEYFEHRAVEDSRQSIMSAVDMRPNNVSLLVDNELKNVSAEKINVGDIILVRPGDRVPLDGIIVNGSTQVNTSAITGESVPVVLNTGDSVTSGYINSLSPIKVRVTNTLKDSMVTRILESVENAAASKPKIDRFLTRFARIYTPVIVIISLLVAIMPPLFFNANWSYWINTSISFLIISCPCALVLSVPLAFFAGIGRASKEGILLKSGSTIESIAKVKNIVMDKTGTITKGNFEVQKIYVKDEKNFSQNELLKITASLEKFSTHPIAKSILKENVKRNLGLYEPVGLKEIVGKGLVANINDRKVLCGNQKLFDDNGIQVETEFLVGTQVHIAVEDKYIGSIFVSDTLKDNVSQSITDLKQKGFSVSIVTGDTKSNTKAVLGSVGIDGGDIYCELLPEQKLNVLKRIRMENGATMFVGDGINDAPVLAGADVGAAMGDGSESAIEVADIVFMNSNIDSIIKSIKISKMVKNVAVQNVVIAVFIKVLIMILGLTGFTSTWFAVIADTGVAVICILNSMRLLWKK